MPSMGRLINSSYNGAHYKQYLQKYLIPESAEHRTQHVGILPNGDPKGPHHTGTGDHGKFYVN